MAPRNPSLEYPMATESEYSAKRLETMYIGSRADIQRELNELHENLIDLATTILTKRLGGDVAKDVAKRNVDQHILGMRIPLGGGKPCMHLTELGRAVWQEEYERKERGQAALPAAEDDKSAKRLSREYEGWNVTIKKELEALNKALIGDIVASGVMIESEAAEFVSGFLVGMRKPRTSSETWHTIGSEGERVWSDRYPRERRAGKSDIELG